MVEFWSQFVWTNTYWDWAVEQDNNPHDIMARISLQIRICIRFERHEVVKEKLECQISTQVHHSLHASRTCPNQYVFPPSQGGIQVGEEEGGANI
jgi:hypothetical protein